MYHPCGKTPILIRVKIRNYWAPVINSYLIVTDYLFIAWKKEKLIPSAGRGYEFPVTPVFIKFVYYQYGMYNARHP
jgi:hypothetical protein